LRIKHSRTHNLEIHKPEGVDIFLGVFTQGDSDDNFRKASMAFTSQQLLEYLTEKGPLHLERKIFGITE
jgi:hypothetical protein